jgi:hypothetical protein
MASLLAENFIISKISVVCFRPVDRKIIPLRTKKVMSQAGAVG